MSRAQSRYVCQGCGAAFLRWEGQCRSCGAWNSLVETVVRESPRASAGAARTAMPGREAPRLLGEVVPSDTPRVPVGIGELDRVLGGGIVPGSLILVAGEPGIGKSTLLLQAAAQFGRAAEDGRAGNERGGNERARGERAGVTGGVLYASGEESVAQVHLRAERLGLLDGPAAVAIRVVGETDVERIVELARELRPGLLIVDSVQTATVTELEGPAGSVGQVRESALRIMELAKGEGIAAVLVGHVTKEGSIAGPKVLEHLVDAVLTLEGDRQGALRLLRATKNRFGSTEEVGVFEMAESGLREVSDPARAFLVEHDGSAPGSIVVPTLEGSRPLMVEVQALVAPAGLGAPRRTTSGIDPNRVALLIAVLGRRAGVGLGSHDVYVNLAGGLSVDEPGLDLPVAIALASTLRDRPVGPGTVAVGEIGLLGELRSVASLERRLREAVRLGFRRAIVPSPARGTAMPRIDGLEIVAVATLRDALGAALVGGGATPLDETTPGPPSSRNEGSRLPAPAR